MGAAAAKEGGKHESEDLSQELFLAAQAPFDLKDQVIGHAQVQESLVEGFNVALGLFLLAFVAFFGVETAPPHSFGLFFGVWSGGSHGDILHLRSQWYED
jgi:hypothetical protein